MKKKTEDDEFTDHKVQNEAMEGIFKIAYHLKKRNISLRELF